MTYSSPYFSKWNWTVGVKNDIHIWKSHDTIAFNECIITAMKNALMGPQLTTVPLTIVFKSQKQHVSDLFLNSVLRQRAPRSVFGSRRIRLRKFVWLDTPHKIQTLEGERTGVHSATTSSWFKVQRYVRETSQLQIDCWRHSHLEDDGTLAQPQKRGSWSWNMARDHFAQFSVCVYTYMCACGGALNSSREQIKKLGNLRLMPEARSHMILPQSPRWAWSKPTPEDPRSSWTSHRGWGCMASWHKHPVHDDNCRIINGGVSVPLQTAAFDWYGIRNECYWLHQKCVSMDTETGNFTVSSNWSEMLLVWQH